MADVSNESRPASATRQHVAAPSTEGLRDVPGPPPSDAAESRRAAVLAYLVGFLSGAVVLWRYRGDEFVSFHAWQSILFSVVAAAMVAGLSTVPIAGLVLAAGILALGGVVWVILVLQAWRGTWFMLPLIGDIAYERSRAR